MNFSFYHFSRLVKYDVMGYAGNAEKLIKHDGLFPVREVVLRRKLKGTDTLTPGSFGTLK